MHPLQRPALLLVPAILLSLLLAACSPAVQSLAPAPATPTVVGRIPTAFVGPSLAWMAALRLFLVITLILAIMPFGKSGSPWKQGDRQNEGQD